MYVIKRLVFLRVWLQALDHVCVVGVRSKEVRHGHIHWGTFSVGNVINTRRYTMSWVRGTQAKVFWHFQAASEGRVGQLESQTSHSLVGGGAVIGQFEGSEEIWVKHLNCA